MPASVPPRPRDVGTVRPPGPMQASRIRQAADKVLYFGEAHPYLAAATPREIILQREVSRSAWLLAAQPGLLSHADAARLDTAAQLDGERFELVPAAADLAVIVGERRSLGGDARDRLAVSAVEHEVCRTRVSVSVDHVARRMINNPPQVGRIIIDKMLHAANHAGIPTRCHDRRNMASARVGAHCDGYRLPGIAGAAGTPSRRPPARQGTPAPARGGRHRRRQLTRRMTLQVGKAQQRPQRGDQVPRRPRATSAALAEHQVRDLTRRQGAEITVVPGQVLREEQPGVAHIAADGAAASPRSRAS